MATSIARPVAEVLERTVGHEATEWAGEHILGSMERYFQPDHPKWGPQDAALKEQAVEFGRQTQVHLGAETKELNHIHDTINSFPDLKDRHGSGQTSIAQIHTDLQNHPDPKAQAAAQSTASIIARHPTNPGRTMLDVSNRSLYTARRNAEQVVFGNNHSNLNPHFYKILQMAKTDPEAQLHADQLADVFSHITHDRVPGQLSGDMKFGDVSRTKKDIEKWVTATNKFKSPGQEARQLENMAPVYTSPSQFERKATAFTYRTVAPWIVIPHLGQTVNLAADIFRNVGKTVLSLSDKDFRETMANYGVTAATQHSILNETLAWEQGRVSKVIGSRPAAILGKFLYNPAFHPMRLSQLMLGGAVGYHAMEKMGEDAMAGHAGAMENLRRLGLDPQAIIARGGKLEDDELGKGMYHFVNDRFFIDKTLQRSVRSSSNFYLRNMAMFKTFVTYQSSFIGRELSRLVKTRDFVGLASFGGTVGIAFPFIAPFIKAAETYTRSADWDETKSGFKGDYRGLVGPDTTAMHRLGKYTELMGYLGAWGMFHSFWKAAEGHRLADSIGSILGGHPLLGAIGEEAQDIYTGAKGTKRGEHHWQPAVRNALKFAVPAYGGAIGKKFFPTPGARKREEDEE